MMEGMGQPSGVTAVQAAWKGCWHMGEHPDAEALRQMLLDEVYAGAFSGLDAMLADEAEIRLAGPEELEQLARRYGILQ